MSMPTHYLYPSKLYASRSPHLVHTVLGSCVSVCLLDPLMRIGGINHYMLPTWNGVGVATPRYGNISIGKLIEKLEQLGCVRSRLEAKVFGGGHVLQRGVESSNIMDVGARNVDVANHLLAEESIPIVAQSVGGSCGRKLIYNNKSGEVFVKKLQGNRSY